MSLPRPNQDSGPMAGHVRKGRVFSSPLAASNSLIIGDWLREDAPDLLWPLLVLAERGTPGAKQFINWQKSVLADLNGKVEPKVLADGLDGRLSSLEKLAAHLPGSESTLRDRAAQHGLVPESVASVLASFPSRPAHWLVPRDLAPPGQAEIDLLLGATVAAMTDVHREALVKCLSIWARVQAGTFSAGPDLIELLIPYPNDARTRDRADTTVRSAWGAHKALVTTQDPDRYAGAIEWARVFWRMNSITTRCVRKRDPDANDDEDTDVDKTSDPIQTPDDAQRNDPAPASVPEDGEHLRGLALDLVSSFVEALETAPSSLFDHEVQEVHSGLVVRAGREVITALGAPDLWCMEHGSHITRVLVEVRIYLQWMSQQEPTIYREFQDYGAGKAKLYARILDEVPEEARQPDFAEAVEELETLSHNGILDHRIVDTRDSFAGGKSIRAMADECGLLDLYRQAYSLASGVSHSEWWSVELHAMERCLNPLHGGHLIPSLSLNSGANTKLASAWVDQLYTLIRFSLHVLGTDQTAVDDAFDWLDVEEPPSSAPEDQ